MLCLKISMETCLLLCLLSLVRVSALEFTFDLTANREDCFYEAIHKNKSAYLEFQVSAGGQLDVDVVLKDPHGKIIYEKQRARFDSYQIEVQFSGIYTACFNNKFSTFAHKFVYVDFHVGEEPVLPGIDDHAAVLTQLEDSSQTIHKSLNYMLDAQTHFRIRKAQRCNRAEDVNDRVLWWSVMQTLVIICAGIMQIVILRSLFSERIKAKQSNYIQNIMLIKEKQILLSK